MSVARAFLRPVKLTDVNGVVDNVFNMKIYTVDAEIMKLYPEDPIEQHLAGLEAWIGELVHLSRAEAADLCTRILGLHNAVAFTAVPKVAVP